MEYRYFVKIATTKASFQKIYFRNFVWCLPPNFDFWVQQTSAETSYIAIKQ